MQIPILSPSRSAGGDDAVPLALYMRTWASSTLALAVFLLAKCSSRPSLGEANGQLLVVRRATDDRADGHGAAASAVLDDLALLRAVKAAAGRRGVVDGTKLASCRMHAGWPDLRDGYRKSLWGAFGSTAGTAGTLALLRLVYRLPPAAALRGSPPGALGDAAAIVGRMVTARATGGRAWPDALAHPASIRGVRSPRP